MKGFVPATYVKLPKKHSFTCRRCRTQIKSGYSEEGMCFRCRKTIEVRYFQKRERLRQRRKHSKKYKEKLKYVFGGI
jgi:hypothetical protein